MRRKLRFTTESRWGQRDGSPNASFFIPCDTNDTFSPMATSQFWTLRDGSGLNVPRARGNETVVVGATLNTRLDWAWAGTLALLAQRCGGAGSAPLLSTTPWPTDQRNADLPSGTIDFGYTFDDETWRLESDYGVKAVNATFAAGVGDSPFLTASYDLVGGVSAPNRWSVGTAPTQTTFPDPTANQLSKNPVVFQECAFNFNGGVINTFDQFSIKVATNTKAYMDNGRFANRVRCRGRVVQLTVRPLLTSSLDPRTIYQNVTQLAQGVSIVFTNPILPQGATNHETLTFDFRSSSYLDSVSEQMQMDEDAYSPITLTAFLDGTAGDDFAITHTPAS